MNTVLDLSPTPLREMLDDVVHRLGDVPLSRIRSIPFPGGATADDCVSANDGAAEGRCELVEGILIEKAAMSYLEDSLATVLGCYLHLFLRETRLGKGFSAGAIYRLKDGNCRLPDYSVCLKDKFPSGRVERLPIAEFAPDLAVEILSRSNTREEIDRKRSEFLASGTRIVWIVNPATRSVSVFRADGTSTQLTESDVLTGEDVLPGFELSISGWFQEAEEV